MGKHLGGHLKLHAVFDRHDTPPLWSGPSRSLIFCEVTLHPSHIFFVKYIGNLQLRHNLSHTVRGPHFYFGLIFLIGSFSASRGTRHSLYYYVQTFLCTPPKNNGAQIETFRFWECSSNIGFIRNQAQGGGEQYMMVKLTKHYIDFFDRSKPILINYSLDFYYPNFHIYG